MEADALGLLEERHKMSFSPLLGKEGPGWSGLMTKLIAVLLSATIVVLCLGGCSDKTAGQLFKYDLDADPANLDPQLANDYASLLVIENTMEAFCVSRRTAGSSEGVAPITPCPTTAPPINHPRQNAKWQTAIPVTAHDFVSPFSGCSNRRPAPPPRRIFTASKIPRATTKGRWMPESWGFPPRTITR